MREAGGELEGGPAFQPFSVVDDNVVTGQNPASSGEVAQKAVEALNARAHWIHVVPYDGAWTFKHEHGEPEGTFRAQKRRSRPPGNMAGRTATGHWSSTAATDASAMRSPSTKADAADTMQQGRASPAELSGRDDVRSG